MRGILVSIAMAMAGAAAHAQLDTYSAMPSIWDAELSPSGTMLATGCSPRGVREICVFDLESGERAAIPEPDGGSILGFYWPSDSHLVYWFNSYQVVEGLRTNDPGFSTVRAVSYNVETRSNTILLGRFTTMTNVGDISSSLVDDEDLVAMELTLGVDQSPSAGSRIGDRRSVETVVYEVSLEDGGLEDVLHTSNASVLEFVLDGSGNALAEVWYDDDSGHYEIHRIEGRRTQQIYEASHPVGLPYIYGLTDDNQALAVRFPETGLRRLDLETGEMSLYRIDGEEMSNIDPIVDPLTNVVVGFSYTDTLPRQRFLDSGMAGLLAELEQILTEDSVTITGWSRTQQKFIVRGRDPGVPANYYLLDLTTGGLGLLDTEYGFPEGTAPGARSLVRYEASDGLEIRGWLTLPPGAGAQDGNFPLVVLPHGGPQARDIGTFDWWAGYYAALGYAVLQPNFRGSEGRGPEFVEAGYGGFGTRMIDDMIDGAHYLQAEGIARPGEYCTAGGSYGGYAALMMALRDSDNVACVVTFAGVTHPFAMLGGAGGTGYARYWEAYMGSRFEDDGYQDSISPMARAGEISQPVLAMHGDEDTTVPYEQMEMLERAAGGRSNFRFVTFEGQDHYFDSQVARRALLEQSGDFLTEHLPVE
jgi:dipeptidyl aminopeptidase/acylaminoacyl peptidase